MNYDDFMDLDEVYMFEQDDYYGIFCLVEGDETLVEQAILYDLNRREYRQYFTQEFPTNSGFELLYEMISSEEGNDLDGKIPKLQGLEPEKGVVVNSHWMECFRFSAHLDEVDQLARAFETIKTSSDYMWDLDTQIA